MRTAVRVRRGVAAVMRRARRGVAQRVEGSKRDLEYNFRIEPFGLGYTPIGQLRILFKWKRMAATQTTVEIRLLVNLCGLKALLVVRKGAWCVMSTSLYGKKQHPTSEAAMRQKHHHTAEAAMR
eukprot:755998-Pelagomonas_calceolata.AAC.2